MKMQRKVISVMAVWVTIQLALLLTSGFLSNWHYCIPLQGKLCDYPLNYVGAAQTGLEGLEKAEVAVSSKRLLFPFPSNSVKEWSEYGWFFSGKVDAFDVRFYDWTDFLFYTLLPLLCILAVKLSDKVFDRIELSYE